MVLQSFQIIDEDQNGTCPSNTMTCQPQYQDYFLALREPLPSAFSPASSCDTLVSVSQYPPLLFHASTNKPVPFVSGSVLYTAPSVPSLETTPVLTMVEALKKTAVRVFLYMIVHYLCTGFSGHGTMLLSSSCTYYIPSTLFAVLLKMTRGAFIYIYIYVYIYIYIYIYIKYKRQPGHFAKLLAIFHSLTTYLIEASPSVTVPRARQRKFLQIMTSLLGDPYSVSHRPSCHHSQGRNTSPIQ